MKGLQKYTTNEAQNITLGQAGVAFLSGTGTYTPPSGQVVVAIQFMEDTRFDNGGATTAESLWPTDDQGGAGTGGQAINQSVMLAGTTIYGRWNTVAFDSGKAFLYLG
tara:strand:- start:953 stop:1276 length:324 start_codon:yes stop_codon:yes gene_type:complete